MEVGVASDRNHCVPSWLGQSLLGLTTTTHITSEGNTRIGLHEDIAAHYLGYGGTYSAGRRRYDLIESKHPLQVFGANDGRLPFSS